MKKTNLTVVSGDDKVWAFAITDPNDNAVDLTGYTEVEFNISLQWDSPTPTVELKLGSGTAIVSPATDGKVTAALTAAQTASLGPASASFSSYVWDLKIVDSASKIETVARGTLIVDANAG